MVWHFTFGIAAITMAMWIVEAWLNRSLTFRRNRIVSFGCVFLILAMAAIRG